MGNFVCCLCFFFLKLLYHTRITSTQAERCSYLVRYRDSLEKRCNFWHIQQYIKPVWTICIISASFLSGNSIIWSLSLSLSLSLSSQGGGGGEIHHDFYFGFEGENFVLSFFIFLVVLHQTITVTLVDLNRTSILLCQPVNYMIHFFVDIFWLRCNLTSNWFIVNNNIRTIKGWRF